MILLKHIIQFSVKLLLVNGLVGLERDQTICLRSVLFVCGELNCLNMTNQSSLEISYWVTLYTLALAEY